MAEIVPFLQALVQRKGSDLHIASGSRPMLRLQGDIVPLGNQLIEKAQVDKLVSEILTPAQKTNLNNSKQLDMALRVRGLGVFRLNIFMQNHGLSIAARALTEHPPTLQQLGLPEIFRRACNYANGLVLVTGPTGSGKSTTLAAMLNDVNTNQRGHIITLEDPIEFFHESKTCLVNQRQLGTHFTEFKDALKAALREDPDVILVGELRDLATMELAITAAETGHLVFGTLHTNSAAKSVDRLIDSFPGDRQQMIRTMLAESLKMVVSQKLLPRKDGKGRIAFFDVLMVNPAISNLMREGKTYQIPSVMQMNRGTGMQIMDQSILEAVTHGIIDGNTAWEAANDKNLFERYAPKEMLSKGLAQTLPGMSLNKKAS